MSRSDVTSEHEIQQLIAVAERKRKANRIPLADAREASGHDAIATEAVEDDDEQDEAKPVRKRAKRKPRALEAAESEAEPVGKSGPGLVTRGIHVGLNGAQWTKQGAVRLGAWGCAAVAMIAVLVVFSCYSIDKAPTPLPVSGFRVAWLPGPKIPREDVLGWMRSFPQFAQLRDGKQETLDELAVFLRKQPMVSEVRTVSVVHEPQAQQPQQLQRTLEVVMALRQPVMPVVLASGERAWVDAEGWLLPGSLPGPSVRRPVLRAIEWAGIDGVRSALSLWKRLEPQIEHGLVTDIHLHDVLDKRGVQRGVVLYTRHGSRLIWGRPGEERYGVREGDKVRDLIHTIRSHGDLGRIAAVNVRFKEPFSELRAAVLPTQLPGARPAPSQP
ncbi:MAG: hypothetical protein H0W78_00230 [Planctomycetes bacterium]|jgi:hypothetical protein|nr:hypothetical protein [Planctomycetota bacterium]